MLPIWESVSNGWRRKVLFFWGVELLGDVVLMSSLSRNQCMSKSMMIWTCINNNKWRRRSFRRSLRQWRMIWKTPGRNKGGRGRSVWWTLSLLMTVPVAHTTLACCRGTMCTWLRRRLRAMYLLMLNLL